jgi:TrmH family RNA methyltransferase
MNIEEILSKHKHKTRFAGPQNPVVKHIKKLVGNSKPNPRKLFVLEGIWAFNTAREANLHVINLIIAPECIYSPEGIELLAYFAERSEDINIVSEKVFLSISERDEPDGLMAVCALPLSDLAKVSVNNSLVVVLDGLEIPGNVGTILRSCDACGVSAVFLCNKKARLTHPKVVKGSMGALFYIPIIEFESVGECKKWLIDNGFGIYLTDTRAEKSYDEQIYSLNSALVMGGERYGINREWYGDNINTVSIPMLGRCDSLNVAIAATVVLYEMRKRNGYFSKD